MPSLSNDLNFLNIFAFRSVGGGILGGVAIMSIVPLGYFFRFVWYLRMYTALPNPRSKDALFKIDASSISYPVKLIIATDAF